MSGVYILQVICFVTFRVHHHEQSTSGVGQVIVLILTTVFAFICTFRQGPAGVARLDAFVYQVYVHTSKYYSDSGGFQKLFIARRTLTEVFNLSVRRPGDGGGVLIFMHGRSRMTIDRRNAVEAVIHR